MDTRTREAIRYLGYGKHAVDDKTLALVKDCLAELDCAADRRIIYRIFDLSLQDGCRLTIGTMEVQSRNLMKNMKGCREALVLGATLGTRVDMLMKRYSLTDMARAAVFQACAAAVLEDYLDACQEEIGQKLESEGKYLRPRFSPGYGDFSIQNQGQILRMLDAAKRIGLSMTDSFMLTPTKSVTAVTGISTTKEPCHIKGCEACLKTDCIYRRNGK